MFLITGEGTSEAVAEITASPDLNGKHVECTADNYIMDEPLHTSKQIQVLCK